MRVVPITIITRDLVQIKMKIILTLVACVIATSTVTVHAHHSFSAVYDVSSTIELEGKVAQFLFRNPHSVLHVLVPDESGATMRWAVEWQGATQLGAGGACAHLHKRSAAMACIDSAERY